MPNKIGWDEFRDLMKRLEAGRERLHPEDFDVYYEKLSDIDYYLLKLAVERLLEKFPFKRFPTIAEILKVVSEIRNNEMPKTTRAVILPPKREKCDLCDNAGFYFDQISKRAKFCRCYLGRKKEIAFLLWPHEELIKDALKEINEDDFPPVKLDKDQIQKEEEIKMINMKLDIEEILKRTQNKKIEEEFDQDYEYDEDNEEEEEENEDLF